MSKLLRKLVDIVNLRPKQFLVSVSAFSAAMVLLGTMGMKAVFFPMPYVTRGELPPSTVETVDFTRFLSLADAGKLKSVEFSATRLVARDAKGDEFVLNHDRRFSDERFPQELARKGVEVSFPEPNQASFADYVLIAVQIAIQLLMLAMFGVIGVYGALNARKLMNPGWPPVARDVPVRFSDVAGQEGSKYELEEIRSFLMNPAAFERAGARPPKGVLLVGPPGNGKTMLAEALAGETGVSYLHTTGSEFSEMFVGMGRSKVQKLFRKARKMAPCIVFIDEIDSLARSRGGSNTDVGREQDTTLNQLLAEMDGFGRGSGVIVIGATNDLSLLDKAATRAGRFDRHVYIGLPDVSDREKILAGHARSRKLAAEVDLAAIAKATPGLSGAELANLVNEAATFAARACRDTLSASDFMAARDKLLVGSERHSGALDPDEKRLTAYHEAGHAVVACLTEKADPVYRATIIPHARSLGHVMQMPEKEWRAVPRSRLLARLDVMVAGRMAEELAFGPSEVTTGAAGDIEEATRVATAMVSEWGMSERIGMRRIDPARDGSDPSVAEEIQRLIDDACGRVRKLLVDHAGDLERVAAALADKETLSGAEIRSLLAA